MSYYINLSVLSNDLNYKQKKEERRKLLSAEARRILSLCENRPITDDDIAREESGRPFLLQNEDRKPDTDFSISHSGALTAVSLVMGKNLRTGCDVEFVRPRKRAREIALEFFTVQERDYIEANGNFDMTRFYHIWTLKECYIKLRGGSVFDMPNAPSFIRGACFPEDLAQRHGGTEKKKNNSLISYNLYELSDNVPSIEGEVERYILATALEGKEFEQPEIRWFSNKKLVLVRVVRPTTPEWSDSW